VDITRERTRLAAELATMEREIARSEKLLQNEGYRSKAPAEVVDKERAKLEDLRQRHARLAERLRAIQE
jgi:valyl-tRNA synthetase